MSDLPRITDFIDEHPEDCPICLGDALVCEDHPGRPWDPDGSGYGCDCGAAGMPCPGAFP